MLPQIKKKIKSFLSKEDGKISKETLLKTGILISSVAFAAVKDVTAKTVKSHENSISHNYEAGGVQQISGTHTHALHSQHSSY